MPNILKISTANRLKILLLCFGLMSGSGLHGQSYLQRLNDPEISLGQKIAHFSDGDLLIGDSSFEESSGDGTEALFLTRMDPCGRVVWSFAYEKKGIQLECKDLAISDRGEIFVFGIASDGVSAVLFLLKANPDGAKERFQFVQSDSPSHAAFSMDIRNDQILLLGSMLKVGSPRTGFIALFDTDLNFQWANRITPFTYEGSAIITPDNEWVARSGAFHYQFDAAGNLQWAKQFDFNLAPAPIAGPYKITAGHLYEAYFQDKAFFYKLDAAGRLLWKSLLFSSSTFPAAVHEMETGDLLIHFSAPEGPANGLRQLTLAPAGEMLEEKKLASDFYFNIGSVFHAIGENGTVNIIGNDDALTASSVEKTDYLMQFSLNEAEPGCFEWVDMQAATSNDYPLNFPELAIDVVPLDMQVSIQGGLISFPRESPYYEVCATTPAPRIIKADTLLGCEANWQVSLPSAAFEWEDGYPEATRLLEATGAYRARNSDCGNPLVYEFQLDRALCDCEVYLPNAFSPNGDGRNDVLELFSNCQLTEIEASVFDRWGNLVFQGHSAENLWDGTVRRENAKEGVYILMVNYVLRSASGGVQEGTLAGEIVLVR